ncbi:MAG TPA: O-antigen ligase family protein [Vineibacter sp.]|nr:O-antigen ligase family protein [Vineibacter sp.]
MSSIIFWGLAGIVCLAPLPLASNRPLPWSILSLAVGALLLLWAIGRLRADWMGQRSAEVSAGGSPAVRGASGRPVDRHAAVLAVGFSLLLVWYWLQASLEVGGGWGHDAWHEAAAALGEPLPGLISLDPTAGETLLMKILAYGAVLFLALDLGRDRARARMAIWLISFAGLFYALYGLGAHFTGAGSVLWFVKDAYPDSVTATFVNRNAYATYAGMGVIAGLALAHLELRRLRGDRLTLSRLLRTISESGSVSLYLAIIATVTGTVAVILTGSRAGLACLALALVVFGVCMLIAGEIRLRTFLIASVVAVVAGLGVLSLSGGFLAKRLASETTPDARAAIFDGARAAVADRPWTGHGLGSFGPAFNRLNDGRAAFDTYVDLAHNSYIELAAEVGVPAMLLSVALLGSCIGICFSGLFARDRAASTSIAAVAVATLVGTHAMVDFGIQMPAVAVTFLLLIGVATAQALSVEQPGRATASASARGEGRWRSPRRGRFGLERPQHADDAVTPPPTLDAPWPRRAEPPDLSPRNTAVATRGTVEVLPPAKPEPPPLAADDDYETAMARWRAVRPTDERPSRRAGPESPTPGPAASNRTAAPRPAPDAGATRGPLGRQPDNLIDLTRRPPRS